MKKIIFQELVEKVKEVWEPQDVAFINETALRIAKVEGSYKWHTHQKEDEFFLVIKGKVFIDFDGKSVELKENEGFSWCCSCFFRVSSGRSGDCPGMPMPA